MLVHLSIRDIVLIDKLDLDFAPKLSVLTGETGAGKSIVLDSFSLALGARGDAALVRAGAEQGQVTAAFEVGKNHPARKVLSENGVDGDELILRRVQLADGRTRAFINDQPVSVQVLREVGKKLVEIHGQHDERALIDSATHRSLLDAFGGNLDQAAEVEALWNGWREAVTKAEEERARVEKANAEADYIRHAVEEMTALAPQPGEENELAERRARMMGAEKISEDLRDAHETVAGSGSPVPSLSASLRRLERRTNDAPELVGAPVKALETAINALEEARDGLERALRAADFDPQELERIEERLFALRAAARKYRTTVDQLPEVAARFAADLEAIDRGSKNLAKLEAAAKEGESAYRAAAEKLSAARKKAGTALGKAVNRELAPLKLERAEFIVEIESDAKAAGPAGIDRVEFWVRTNPGSKPGPLMKVASGGELARFLLALKVVLADKGSAPTLVFDEIDTAVGGAVSDAIGARLARLGEKVQVFSVSHAPQVAARAAHHFLVSKEPASAKKVVTRVRALESKQKREEIARMLAGAEVTEEARAAAEKLIAGAGR
ncbi:MAG TPA: DNA repair protein RecN [Xanthobacteraceae bacterium]|jgi:DNA repair protein RecN (Recombination protein N)|nr:DNA repair protein RecN [Xanthobacteraceae bacterium]